VIDKNIIALGWVSFFTDMASSMVTSILPLYIVYALHAGVDKLGMVVAIATFVSYAFRVVFGYISDRYRIVKPLVVTGYALSAVTKPMLAWSTSWQSVAALRGLERMGKAVRSATKDSLIATYAGEKSGRTFGFHKTMDIAGELVGSLLVFGVLYRYGESVGLFRLVFGLTLVPGLIAVLIAWFFVTDAPYTSNRTVAFDARKDREMLPVLLIYFGFVFFVFNDSFLMIRAKEAGFSVAFIPLLVVAYHLTQTLTSYLFGTRIDRLGTRKVLGWGYLFGMASTAALFVGWITAGFVLLGLFAVASLNALRAHIAQHACNTGTVYGLLYGGVALSAALGALTTGTIWERYGSGSAMLFSLTGMGGVALLHVFGKQTPDAQKGLDDS
jgi:MFS family permease